MLTVGVTFPKCPLRAVASLEPEGVPELPRAELRRPANGWVARCRDGHRTAGSHGEAAEERLRGAIAAAHEALVALYPTLTSTLDAELRQSLAQIPDGQSKTEGIRVGQTVADSILALRSNDGSNAQPIPYVFGNAPGDYQSTPPNFPPQPQFTHWSRVTPFVLERANQFRPDPPPVLASDQYGEAVNEIKSVGIAGSTTATADEALTGRFWNGAIQNYWNEITQTASAAHHLTTAENAQLFALLNLGRLSNSKGPITIPGLWGLRFAPATPGAGPNTLYFTAGINGEADGLFGDIIPNR